ncbi:conserved hypothetical protein [Paenibacillus curdlanolyticus YK9]|uniref:DinB-like domain-containing protein n=1 Tax=Paenibacillus curdlanolyticus YK9 TaxID=717606 RepID=E0I4G5_9BACL|nr:DinB family protein [Paenibacillus curdlanolyticus]EFM12496.1 conserved hypothetical protein [Paenibacillus curdlanolyticus YK9]
MSESSLIAIYQNGLHKYSMEQLRSIPEPGVWSLGQMYDHVILTALDYLDQVENCSSANEEQSLGKTEAGEHILRQGGFPPIKIKLPNGPENSPSNTETKEELLRGFDLIIHRMEQWETKLDAINPNYKIQHGGFGWLNAREWFGLIDMHFRHHLRQKNELEQRL